MPPAVTGAASAPALAAFGPARGREDCGPRRRGSVPDQLPARSEEGRLWPSWPVARPLLCGWSRLRPPGSDAVVGASCGFGSVARWPGTPRCRDRPLEGGGELCLASPSTCPEHTRTTTAPQDGAVEVRRRMSLQGVSATGAAGSPEAYYDDEGPGKGRGRRRCTWKARGRQTRQRRGADAASVAGSLRDVKGESPEPPREKNTGAGLQLAAGPQSGGALRPHPPAVPGTQFGTSGPAFSHRDSLHLSPFSAVRSGGPGCVLGHCDSTGPGRQRQAGASFLYLGKSLKTKGRHATKAGNSGPSSPWVSLAKAVRRGQTRRCPADSVINPGIREAKLARI